MSDLFNTTFSAAGISVYYGTNCAVDNVSFDLKPGQLNAGAILLTLADILARSVSTSELPVSIFTSLLGAPLLIILLIRANKKEGL